MSLSSLPGRGRSARRASVGVVAITVLLTLLIPPALLAHAEGTPTRQASAPVVIILDASGSMNDPDPSGGTKLDAAKSALHAVLDALPDDSEVGLVVYGGRSSGNKREGCADIETVFPPAPLNRQAMASAVSGIDAAGWTPIGGALRQAAKELPLDGPRSVVLISDGAETCGPPSACESADELAAAGVDLVMHTVGFGVGGKAREELRCIAHAGSGRYVEAPDAETLLEELPIITHAALRSYETAGQPVTGATAPRDAPTLGAGQYVDRINSGDARYYALDVPDGMTVHAAATQIRPASEGSGGIDATYLDLEMLTAERRRCAHDRDVDSDMTWNAQNTVAVRALVAPDSRCHAGDGRYYLRIERGTSSRSLGERAVEILVAFEPPVRSEHGQSQQGWVPFADSRGDVRRVLGGGSFNNATSLTETGTYTDRIGFGEAVFFRVPLDWGQGLAYQVRLESRGRPAIANIKTQLYNPSRDTDYSDGTRSTAYSGRPMALDPVSTPYVYHGNRAVRGGAGTASLAGDYYIVVQVAFNVGRGGSGPVDVEIALVVDGEPVDPPDYLAVGGRPPLLQFDEPDDGAAEVTETLGSASASVLTSVHLPRVLAVAGSVAGVLAVCAAWLVWRRRRARPD